MTSMLCKFLLGTWLRLKISKNVMAQISENRKVSPVLIWLQILLFFRTAATILIYVQIRQIACTIICFQFQFPRYLWNVNSLETWERNLFQRIHNTHTSRILVTSYSNQLRPICQLFLWHFVGSPCKSNGHGCRKNCSVENKAYAV